LDIESITVTNPGSNYVSPPTVNIAGGGGNAVADALVGDGGILSLAITNTGAGYIDGSYTAVAILAYPAQPGSGATCSFIISGGKIQPVTIVNPGSGYTNSGTVYLDTVSIGTPSIVAEFQVASDYQTVIGFTNINTFVPFAVAPSVILIGGGGASATAEAVLAPCPSLDLTGCSGDPITMPSDTLAQGEAVVVCDYTTPTVLPQFTGSQSGNCLCSCVTATIGVSGSNGNQVRYYYNKCNGAPATGVLTVAGSPSSIVDCIVPGSLVFVPISMGATGTVSYGASCP